MAAHQTSNNETLCVRFIETTLLQLAKAFYDCLFFLQKLLSRFSPPFTTQKVTKHLPGAIYVVQRYDMRLESDLRATYERTHLRER